MSVADDKVGCCCVESYHCSWLRCLLSRMARCLSRRACSKRSAAPWTVKRRVIQFRAVVSQFFPAGDIYWSYILWCPCGEDEGERLFWCHWQIHHKAKLWESESQACIGCGNTNVTVFSWLVSMPGLFARRRISSLGTRSSNLIPLRKRRCCICRTCIINLLTWAR